MGVLCFHQVFDLLLLCTKCIPCAVALLLHTGVENECRMAEGVAVLLTQHQRVVVERQDQRGVMVDPPPCLTNPEVRAVRNGSLETGPEPWVRDLNPGFGT